MTEQHPEGRVTRQSDPDPFRPAAEILTVIEDVLNAPDVVPPPVTVAVALATDPAAAWPCTDWCCAKGCPGPGNAMCRVGVTGECDGRCTCGEQHTRDVVSVLQDLARPLVDMFATPQPLIVLPPDPVCTRPRWFPRWAHCRTCPRHGKRPL